jgi:hypothetical protein
MARFAPASLNRWAIAQAMLRLLASPQTTALRPCKESMVLILEFETEKNIRTKPLGNC